jgi:hypothetical protein
MLDRFLGTGDVASNERQRERSMANSLLLKVLYDWSADFHVGLLDPDSEHRL